ncbi:cysteine lyase [filamentous cyanobacterium CCP5]|nr:cysteine lyase [filamentous cyanobacterium CCP5]
MNSVSSQGVPLADHRQLFPALTNKAYFNYGGQGPLAQPALEAIQQAQLKIQQEGPFSGEINQWIRQEGDLTRGAIAQAVGAPEEAITLTENVTASCNIPLWGIEWRPGDHILLSDCEHPGLVAAVQEICRRFGVESSVFPLLGAVDPVATIEQYLRPTTRLLLISHLLWNTGEVLPLQDIVGLCHDHGPRPVWVLVDAAQSVGSLPLNLTATGVDFYGFTGHKWWCGPAGIGGLYVRPGIRDQIHPTMIGWRGITMDAEGNPTGWKPGGDRYEVATADYALRSGLRRALAVSAEWGDAAQRYRRICQLAQRLWQQLSQMPRIRCLLSQPPASGLVSFWVLDDHDVPSPIHHKQLVADLETNGFFLRTLAYPSCVRACVHYLTLESEVDALVAAIADWLAD